MPLELDAGIADLDVVLVAGIQGAGKTTLATGLFRDRCRLNLDEIRLFYRRMTAGTPWQTREYDSGLEPLFVSLEEQILRHSLATRRKVVVDNTSITRGARAHYLRIAREFKASIGVLYLDYALDECISGNHSRAVQVPDHVIREFHRRKEIPTRDEGFDLCQIVNRRPASLERDLDRPLSQLA